MMMRTARMASFRTRTGSVADGDVSSIPISALIICHAPSDHPCRIGPGQIGKALSRQRRAPTLDESFAPQVRLLPDLIGLEAAVPAVAAGQRSDRDRPSTIPEAVDPRSSCRLPEGSCLGQARLEQRPCRSAMADLPAAVVASEGTPSPPVGLPVHLGRPAALRKPSMVASPAIAGPNVRPLTGPLQPDFR